MTNAGKHIVKSSTLFLFAVTISAFAGIKEFNASMGRGDFNSAALEADEVWNAYDKSQPAAVTLAREIAFVNYLAGNLDKAREFIGYLTAGENKMLTADDQPDTSNILASLIEFRIDDGVPQRDKLLQSIERRLLRDDTDLISQTGAEYLYSHDWGRGDWIKARDSAKYAVELLKRTGPGTLVRQRTAEAVNVVAGFLDDKENTQHYNNMVDLHDTVVSDVDQTPDLQIRKSLIDLKWLLQAWIQSADVLYTKFDWKLENPVSDFEPRSLKASGKGYFYEQVGASGGLPVCEYSLDTKRVFFPQSNDFCGQIGTVLFKMDVDEDGKVTNAIPLATVPEQRYQMMMGMWGNFIKVRRAIGQSRDSCHINQKNAIVPVSFEIQIEERMR